jgi:hypothetical protein
VGELKGEQWSPATLHASVCGLRARMGRGTSEDLVWQNVALFIYFFHLSAAYFRFNKKI